MTRAEKAELVLQILERAAVREGWYCDECMAQSDSVYLEGPFVLIDMLDVAGYPSPGADA